MRWVSLGVLAGAGVLLALFWGDVPDRWITHWGVHGADGWATKTAGGAAAPLLIGLIAWAVIEAAVVMIRHATAGAASGYPPEMRAIQSTSIRVVGLGVAVLTGALALALPLLQPRSATPVLVAASAVMGAAVAVAIGWAARRARRLREAGVAFPEGYHGVFYSNPRDPRLWVPKLSGLGSTINFAHRRAWPVLAALVGVPLAVALSMVLLAR